MRRLWMRLATPPPAGAPDEARSGPQIIADYVKQLPMKPGVYRMYGADGEALYVGKARRLKARVANYAKTGGHTNRIALMIALTRTMEFVVTSTETEALLLEANLIKRLKPRFNIILRDDKSFPYILIRSDHAAPQLTKHRGARKARGAYFGPFASAGAVNNTLNTLQKAFLLRTCSDSVYESRTRPCMLYQIKRCAAPCVDYVDAEEYAELVADATSFLRGRSNELREALQTQMTAAAEAMDFEHAARPARPHSRHCGGDHPSGHQSRRPGRGRCGGRALRGRPLLRAGVFSSARARTGAIAPSIRAMRPMRARPGCWPPLSRNSMTTSPPRA